MKPADHILLEHMLREREAAFVTVWECERRIRARLGGAAMPFPAPPELPSRRRQARPPPASPRSAAASVRRLRPGEDAYRLTCLHRGLHCESLSAAADVVRILSAGVAADLTVLRLETVALDAAGVPLPVECLWSATVSEHL
jgi:hypothetical protein